MNLLLDTHILLWWLADRARLSAESLALIGDPANQVTVSVVSLWEIAIKAALGKLEMPGDLMGLLAVNEFIPLPITASHALATYDLPLLHKDPFDRLLVAQAMHEGLTLVSRDPWVLAYPVATVGA